MQGVLTMKTFKNILLFLVIMTPAISMPISVPNWFRSIAVLGAIDTYQAFRRWLNLTPKASVLTKSTNSVEQLYQARLNGIKPSRSRFERSVGVQPAQSANDDSAVIPISIEQRYLARKKGMLNGCLESVGSCSERAGQVIDKLNNRYLVVEAEYNKTLKDAEKCKTDLDLWRRLEEIAKEKKFIGDQINMALMKIDTIRRQSAEQQKIPRPAWVIAHEEKYADFYARKRAIEEARQKRSKRS